MSEETQSPVLFNAQAVQQTTSESAAVARATQEIQAALVVAKKFPRDEVRARTKIIEACKRAGLAENAEYEYSRGGTKISGPSIDLLRAVASRWGNVRWGWAEVDRSDGTSNVRVWAWDLESGSQAERTFSVKHWRDTSSGGYALKDERDIYEHIANQAARRVRGCLEEVIDSDIVDDALDQCHRTLREKGGGIPLIDRIMRMSEEFGKLGVTQDMLERRLNQKLQATSEGQFAGLRRIYKSIKDGVGRVEDFFKQETKVEKPVFSTKPIQEVPEPSELPQDAPEGVGEPLPPVPEPAAAPARRSAPPRPLKSETAAVANPVSAVRAGLKSANIAELDMIDYLHGLGSLPENVMSLDEMVLSAPSVLSLISGQLSDICSRIISWKATT
jgi:hypothetical protein